MAVAVPRPVYLDACNIACSASDERHSGLVLRGILAVMRPLIERGHLVTCYAPITLQTRWLSAEDHTVLQRLRDERVFVVTPARKVSERISVKAYDDLILLQQAQAHGGVVVSRDRFDDVGRMAEQRHLAETIDTRRLTVYWQRRPAQAATFGVAGYEAHMFFGDNHEPSAGSGRMLIAPGDAHYQSACGVQLGGGQRERYLRLVDELAALYSTAAAAARNGAGAACQAGAAPAGGDHSGGRTLCTVCGFDCVPNWEDLDTL